MQVRCPPDLPRDVTARVRAISRLAVRALDVRDLGRVDFRLGEDGRLYLLEVNALPSLERGASLFAAAAREGLDYEATLGAIVESAARRQGLMAPAGGTHAASPADAAAHRVHLQHQARRLQGRQRRRGRIRRARDHRLDPRRARELRPRRDPARGDRRAAAAADGVPGRPRLQHRRGGLGPEPRGGGAGAVRADGHPLHRLGRRHACRSPSTRRCPSGCCASTGS